MREEIKIRRNIEAKLEFDIAQKWSVEDTFDEEYKYKCSCE